MQDANERIKRRRLNSDDNQDLAPTRGLLRQTAAFASNDDASNLDVQAWLLRQRMLTEQKQKQHNEVVNGIALQSQVARLNDISSSLWVGSGRDFLRAGGASIGFGAGGASDLFAAVGNGPSVNDDPTVNHLRQHLLRHKLEQVARLQSVQDPTNRFVRASDAAACVGPSSMYASMLASRGAADALFLEQVLHRHQQEASSSLADQLSVSASGRSGTPGSVDPSLRNSYMQSLLEVARDNEATASAMGPDAVALRARLLGLSEPSIATGVVARLHHERAAMLGSGAAGLVGSLNPSGLDPSIPRTSAGGPPGPGFNRGLYLAGGSTGGPAARLTMSGSGMSAGAPANKFQATATPPNFNRKGREPIHLYMSCDDDDLSPYQCLVRKQIELFVAQDVDAETNARGRNRPIVVGQVGIRCKWCKQLPPRKRERAAIYYPSKLDRLYQAGQTMASVHLGQHCNHIPPSVRTELARLREGKSAALGGKKYWSDGARALGVIEDDERLFFRQETG